MTLMASKRPSGDQLIVKTEKLKRKKIQEAAASSSSGSSEEDSLSETTDTEDDATEHNPTALKPIKEFGVDINVKPKREDENPKTKLSRKAKKKLNRVDRAKKMKEHVEHLKFGMVKPDIVADREKERKLAHIATKGVTQLFNTVSERQLHLDAEAKNAKSKKPVNKPLVPEPAIPSLSQYMKIRVPVAPPAAEVKKEENAEKIDPNETVTLNDTDTDMPTEAEIKTEAESDSD